MIKKWNRLQLRMALNYVVVTVSSVLLLEIIVISGFIPLLINPDHVQKRVINTSQQLAAIIARQGFDDINQLPQGFIIGNPQLRPDVIFLQDDQVMIPFIDPAYTTDRPVVLAVVTDTSGTILASSYPAQYQPGSPLQNIAIDAERLVKQAIASATSTSRNLITSTGPVIAAASPILADTDRPIGIVYVHIPQLPFNYTDAGQIVGAVLLSGLGLLIVTVPIGLIFGMITSRNLVRRLSALVQATTAFAAGDFNQHVTVHAPDEIGQLERHFNQMADQIKSSLRSQRELAAQNARLAERSRIARELHDSISQDLFSLRMLTGGLRSALPADHTLQEQLAVIEQTLERIHREMRALLLELRPVLLENQTLADGIAALAEMYAVRLGITVQLNIEPLWLPPNLEQALLRIAQEGIANAVRHANATMITLALRHEGASIAFMLSDDGIGFEPAEHHPYGLGLRLMRERVEEFGGTFVISSAPGQGTRLLVKLPSKGTVHDYATDR